jgi:hypothetical protein
MVFGGFSTFSTKEKIASLTYFLKFAYKKSLPSFVFFKTVEIIPEK